MMASCASPSGSSPGPRAPLSAAGTATRGPGSRPCSSCGSASVLSTAPRLRPALEAVAAAFGARRSAVRLVAGERSRTKVLELEPAPADAAERFEALLRLL